ncbi:MAG: phage tail length tape measure family protein [Pseudomonadota bacterium]
MSLLIDATAEDAKTEIRAVGKEATQTGGAVRQMGRQGDRAAASTRKLGAAASATETELRGVAAAGEIAANTNRQLANSNVMAAGSVANLVAQFNDVGVMMAAGQNPIQLALQQGTQITQVFGNAGAGAAVRSLGAAFMSMISPLNLITIGSIAAGAALFNWLTSSGAEAATFESRMSELKEGIDAYADAVDLAQTPTDELRKKFGAAADEVSRLYREIAQGSRAAAGDTASRSIRAMIDELGFGLGAADASNQALLAKQLDLSNPFFGKNRREVRAVTSDIIADYAALSDAADASVSAQIRALGALYQSFRRGAEASGEISASEQERLKGIADLIAELNRLRLEEQDDDNSDLNRSIAAHQQYYESRIAAEQILANQRQAELADAERVYAFYVQSRLESDAELANAQALLGQLQTQATIRQAIADHGADSLEAANARVSAERAAFEETLASMQVAESLKDQLRQAWEAANGIAGTNIAGSISAGATEAERLANALGIAVSNAIALSTISPQMADEDAAMAQPVLPTAPQRAGHRQALVNFRRLIKPKTGGGGGGGGGGASAAELSEAQELINTLEREIAILNEKDPLQKEILRNSEAIADATAAEREKIEELIATRMKDERAIEGQTDAAEAFSRALYDGFEGLVLEGEKLSDVMENIGRSIANVALEATLLGRGPLAGILGTDQSGGAFGQILSAIFPKAVFGKAGGGHPGPVYGPGSGISDDVPAWLSQGEFVMTAKATRRYRHVLEAMNADAPIAGFAAGGAVGSSGPTNGTVPATTVNFTIENHSSTPVKGRVEETASAGPGRSFKLVLADSVGDALATPGGKAKRTLKGRFGVREQGTVR